MEELHIDRLSPVFFAWHDSGENPHLYSSDTYGQRTVAHYEIEYIVSSRSGYILTDSIPIPTEPQSVFFRFPGMVVEGIGVYRSLYVEFDLNETREIFDAFQHFPPVFQNATDSPADFPYFASLCLPPHATDAQKLLWKANILRLLAFLLRQMQDDTPSSSSNEADKYLLPVRHALSYVQTHYSERITLQELADAAGYSVYYFCKLFKEITQLTPMQYVVRYRLEQSKKRLLLSDDPAETVMLEAGFHNYSYFWRAFKEIYGLSPQAYRKKYYKK